MITLSRTQIDALAQLRYSSRFSAHWNTRRSLRKLGLVRYSERQVVLTEAGRVVIDTIGQLTEGTGPLGFDDQGNQNTILAAHLDLNIDLGSSY